MALPWLLTDVIECHGYSDPRTCSFSKQADLPAPTPADALLALQEYADFIKQVEVDSAAAAQQQAAEEEEEAAGRRDREDFEQL